MWHTAIRLALFRIFYPCLMIFGTIGNVLCLKILLRKHFRRQSTCQYLCVLAVIDILFIYMRSSRYLYRHVYKVDLRNTSLWMCRTFIFFSSSLSLLASWILVIVSFDRYFIIKNLFPRRPVSWRVIKSTLILIAIVCAANLYYFFILGTNMQLTIPFIPTTNDMTNDTFYYTTRFVCIAPAPFKEFFRLYVPIFDLLFVAIIPFCLMIFTNIGIIRTTMRSNIICTTSRKQQRNNRLTIMLLSVILAFMLLTCPSVIYICLNRLVPSTAFSDTKLLILDLLEALWYTKHALNFILYTLSGQDFRREFIKLLSCCSKKPASRFDTRPRNGNRAGAIRAQTPSNKSTSSNRLLREPKRKKQLDDEMNDLSTMVTAKLMPVKQTEGVDDMRDSRLVALSASSSAPTAGSLTSDRGRSSSTTRTSTH